MSPQFVNPRPAIIAEVRFRRALLHAINRQDMADTLQAGVAPVAHSFLSPGQGDYGKSKPACHGTSTTRARRRR